MAADLPLALCPFFQFVDNKPVFLPLFEQFPRAPSRNYRYKMHFRHSKFAATFSQNQISIQSHFVFKLSCQVVEISLPIAFRGFLLFNKIFEMILTKFISLVSICAVNIGCVALDVSKQISSSVLSGCAVRCWRESLSIVVFDNQQLV
jgi:hypothetical protein